MITIGIDPHKRTHTAVAIDGHRRKVGELEVAASSQMTSTLLKWAGAWPGARTAGRRIGSRTHGPVVTRVRPVADSRTLTLHGRAVVVSIAVVAGGDSDLLDRPGSPMTNGYSPARSRLRTWAGIVAPSTL